MTSTRAVVTINGPDDRDQVARWAKNVDLGTVVEFRKKTRSVEQNAKLHAMLAEVADQVVWYGQKLKVEDWKNMFSASLRKAQVVPGIDPGTVVPLGIHTSTMTIDEMSNMIELIYAFGADPEHPVTFHDHNTKASDAGGAQTSGDDGTATSPGDAVDEPAGDTVSTPAGSEPSLFGKWNYQGKDLINLREFAKKAFIEARKDGDIPPKLQFLGSMHLNYLDAAESDDARKALNGMNKALELVMKGDRNVDRIGAWFETEFFSEA
jgi:hypothetical protein